MISLNDLDVLSAKMEDCIRNAKDISEENFKEFYGCLQNTIYEDLYDNTDFLLLISYLDDLKFHARDLPIGNLTNAAALYGITKCYIDMGILDSQSIMENGADYMTSCMAHVFDETSKAQKTNMSKAEIEELSSIVGFKLFCESPAREALENIFQVFFKKDLTNS